MALRSAQTASPDDAFSTLHPAATVPFAVSTAAPTGKRLYGLQEFAQQVIAAAASTAHWASVGSVGVVGPVIVDIAEDSLFAAGRPLLASTPRRLRVAD